MDPSAQSAPVGIALAERDVFLTVPARSRPIRNTLTNRPDNFPPFTNAQSVVRVFCLHISFFFFLN